MKWHPFSEIVTDATSKFKKIKATDYKPQGKYKIIDQGKGAIAGYTDDANLVNGQLLPVLIFGDHTRVLKYEEEPIALGADGAKALLVNPDLAIPRYVYYYLRSIEIKEAGYSRHFKFLKKVDIPIPFKKDMPDIDEQIRIVHLLDKVEGLIVQRKQYLQQLDDLLKSVFLEMFGDPVRNEKAWDIKALPELCKKITDGEHLNPQFSNSGMPMVLAGNVLDHTVNIRDAKFVDYALGDSFRKKCNPELSDILLVSRGATIGRLCRVDTTEPFCLMGSVILLKPNHQIVNSTFLVSLLKHPALYLKLFKSSGSSAQQAIYLKDVKRLICVLPPLDLQSKFSVFAEKVELTKESYRRNLTDLESLYGVLSQQAFKGELDLSRVTPVAQYIAPDMLVNQSQIFSPAIEQLPAINLPDIDLLLPALEDRRLVKNLLHEWLEFYCAQLGNVSFSVASFMNAAQIRIAELHPDTDFELGLSDYENIKNWIFGQIESGALKQTRNIISVNEKRQFGNKINLRTRKSRTQ
jgi:type I restriction enzyme S subunit